MDTTSSSQKEKRMCPCGRVSRSSLERVRRTAFEKFFVYWFSLKKYRCHTCKKVKWLVEK